GVLDTASHDQFDLNTYRRLLQAELERVETALQEGRFLSPETDLFLSPRQADQSEGNEAFEPIAEDAAGRLVAPATVASKVFKRFQNTRKVAVEEMLEEESQVMLEQALKIGSLLELPGNALDGIAPFKWPSRRSRKKHQENFDFTPGAQGAWKAFENEVNFSII